jgi:ribonuclease P protein subunit POP4
MITPENIVRHELIGLQLKVSESNNKKAVGLSGRVVDESRNTFTVEKKDGKESVIVKEECILTFTLPDGRKVRVDGKIIVARPEDRIKKKFRKW